MMISIWLFTALSLTAPQYGAGTGTNSTSVSTSTNKSTVTTTVSPELACQYYNQSCEECVKHTKCYYCYSTSQCLYYPYSSGFPSSSKCNWEEIRWAVCWFNFKALTISLACMAGVLFISLAVCTYCCCRKKKTRKVAKYAQEEAKREREREERRLKAEARRLDRKEKNDEIRRKYGLMKDDQPYHRFDA